MTSERGLIDETGQPMSPDRKVRIRQVFQLLFDMNQWDRGLVLCWYCKFCHRYVGPGDYCNCAKDE